MHLQRTLFTITTLAATTLIGCAQTPEKSPLACAQPFYVPTTLILQTPDPHPQYQSQQTPLSFQVLAAANYEESYFPRGEKFIYGSTPLEAISSFSVFTYDVQRISSPRLGGYRYTWDVKSGVSVP